MARSSLLTVSRPMSKNSEGYADRREFGLYALSFDKFDQRYNQHQEVTINIEVLHPKTNKVMEEFTHVVGGVERPITAESRKRIVAAAMKKLTEVVLYRVSELDDSDLPLMEEVKKEDFIWDDLEGNSESSEQQD